MRGRVWCLVRQGAAGAESVDALPRRRPERRDRRVALVPVILLAGCNLGSAPVGAGRVAVDSRAAGNLADLETLGASGVLPQTGGLSSDLMAAIDALPHQRSGRGLRLPLARRGAHPPMHRPISVSRTPVNGLFRRAPQRASACRPSPRSMA